MSWNVRSGLVKLTSFLYHPLTIDLNQLTGVAAILNFPLPDIDDEDGEEEEEEQDMDEDGLPPMHSNQNREAFDAILG